MMQWLSRMWAWITLAAISSAGIVCMILGRKWGQQSADSAIADTLDRIENERKHQWDKKLFDADNTPVPGGLYKALDIADSARTEIDARNKR